MVFDFIKSANDLVTTREETRAGFINFALERNKRSTPYVERAKALRALALKAKTPNDLKKIDEIRPLLITSSGVSDKALKHLTMDDQDTLINDLIKNFLEPAGTDFVNELVYRFLLVQGDSLGGSMRNLVGILAEQKLIRAILASLNIAGIEYKWMDSRIKKQVWNDAPSDEYEVELYLKALSWTYKGNDRTLVLNLTVPVVNKNVDICLFDCGTNDYLSGNIKEINEKYILLGELKGGIDPAGADEHWKTANTALGRIRNAFQSEQLTPKTIFIAAAIENSMADEIWQQLNSGELSYAANLTIDAQVSDLCNWFVRL